MKVKYFEPLIEGAYKVKPPHYVPDHIV